MTESGKKAVLVFFAFIFLAISSKVFNVEYCFKYDILDNLITRLLPSEISKM